MSTPNEECQIAISGKRLAIFGSRMGYVGPVIQDYTPFESEPEAVAAARQKVADMGRQCDPKIARPFISQMRITMAKRQKCKLP